MSSSQRRLTTVGRLCGHTFTRHIDKEKSFLQDRPLIHWNEFSPKYNTNILNTNDRQTRSRNQQIEQGARLKEFNQPKYSQSRGGPRKGHALGRPWRMSKLKSDILTEDTYKFQNKSCEDQFKFNKKLNVALKEADSCLEPLDEKSAHVKHRINEGIELLTYRQKLVKMADSSEHG
ncbi:unnamed protein product [Mytilus coruscus]|uniref:Uncharacterized protein n=1 Tax=Mytilus coruscus TaxID=42192 RepID=A0A6J8ED15_MYTCO|nr:unnamed protein product [Mytilus coruscus]